MRVVIAIGVSVFVHLILAAALWWYFTVTPDPVVLAQLDLSSVELSIADEDVAAAQPVARSETFSSDAERTPRPQKVAELERPPVSDLLDPTMPALSEPKLPEVTPPAPDLPQIVDAAPSPRQNENDKSIAPKQAKVDAPPKPKRAIRPDYPHGARLRNEEGDVVLEIHVAADGGVSGVKVVGSSGFAELDEAAVRAAKAARFTPAKSGRESVASVARLKLTFRLK